MIIDLSRQLVKVVETYIMKIEGKFMPILYVNDINVR